MNELLDLAMQAHGGIIIPHNHKKWRSYGKQANEAYD